MGPADAVTAKQTVDEIIEQQLARMQLEKISQFVDLIETEDERGAEVFVQISREIAAHADRACLQSFFDCYFPRLRKEAQIEVASFFGHAALFDDKR